ncbi:BnaCnng77000D [Brassica napus]|uniref:BnaCnng77000D protein n=2 Tax=Brassica napus TaxID=3708 RepID=A0A078K055_BRANA|nr:BnaCnng77000D [Brassica napus]
MTTEDTCSRLECQFQCILKRKGWATCFKDADDLYKGTPVYKCLCAYFCPK